MLSTVTGKLEWVIYIHQCIPSTNLLFVLVIKPKNARPALLSKEIANSLRLIEELLLCSHDGIQLSEYAVAGLTETLSRAERMIDR